MICKVFVDGLLERFISLSNIILRKGKGYRRVCQVTLNFPTRVKCSLRLLENQVTLFYLLCTHIKINLRDSKSRNLIVDDMKRKLHTKCL